MRISVRICFGSAALILCLTLFICYRGWQQDGKILHLLAASGSVILFCLFAVAFVIRRPGARRTELAQALRASETKAAQVRDLLHTTLSSIGDGVIAANAEGAVTFLNHSAQRLTGWFGDDALGHPLAAVWSVESSALNVLRDGAAVTPDYETVLISKDGSRILIGGSAAPIRGPDGATIGFVFVFRDLTASKRAEEAQQSLSAIVEFSDDAIVGRRLDGTITSWNGAAARNLGYSAAEMIGSTLTRLIPPDAPGGRGEILERVGRGEQVPRIETIWRRQDGEQIEMEMKVSPIRDASGRIAGASTIAHDITARKCADQAMRESEERFRSLFDSNLVAIAFSDSRDLITEANDAYLSIIGYTREEFAPGTINWRDLTPPEYQALDEIAQQEAFSHSTSTLYEKEYIRRDGKRIPIVMGLVKIHNAKQGGLAFALDLSERKRMQEQALRSQKLESLSVLAGGIAHDFNNLLMSIMANASIMMEEVPPDSPLTRLAERILAATEQAAHLTRQMSAYSGRGRYTVEPVSLRTQVEAVSSLIASSIPKGIKLKLKLAPDLAPIPADAGQIRQVALNLALNAAEAIAADGVVTISAYMRQFGEADHPGNLAGAPLPAGQYVMLEVSDTGAGMDEATQAKMFDPFFTTKFTGRGLGLAAVLGIVRGHGGGIAVSSEPGKGTSFQVFFPVARKSKYAALPGARIGASG